MGDSPPTVYHTCASRRDLRRARDAAPSLSHGYGWIPKKMCSHPDAPWFLDNGAYRKWQNGEPANPPERFWERLAEIEERMPRDPEFVVLPDIPGDAATLDHAGYYLDNVSAFGYPTYLPIHRGMHTRHQIPYAARWECEGVFLGGDLAWKRGMAEATVALAHDRGLNVHVGRPERAAAWFFEVGVDSVDTSGFSRNDDWGRLARLGQSHRDDTRQTTLG